MRIPKIVRKGNDDSNVRFSRKLERTLKNRKVMDITCEDGETRNEWIVGYSGAGYSVIANANRKQGHLKGYRFV